MRQEIIKRSKKKKEYITLQEAAKISGYAPDYIGWLIRRRKIEGKKIFVKSAWLVNTKSLIKYCQKRKNLNLRYLAPIFKRYLQKKYLTLKEASKISGYASDYIGYLLRKKKIKGKRTKKEFYWVTTEKAIRRYLKKKKLKRKDLISLITLSPVWEKTITFFLTIPKYALVWGFLGFVAFGGFLVWATASKNPIQKVNVFPTRVEGDWEQKENVLGLPDVPEDGNINFFTKENSAIYKNGSQILILSDFSTTQADLEKEIEQATGTIISPTTTTPTTTTSIQATSTKEKSTPENLENLGTTTSEISTTSTSTTEEIGTTTEATGTTTENVKENATSTLQEIATSTKENLSTNTQEVASTSSQTIENTKETSSSAVEEKLPLENKESTTTQQQENATGSVSLFERFRNYFKNIFVQAKEISKFETLIKKEFVSAKIKFSFAQGEKEPDLEILKENTTLFEKIKFVFVRFFKKRTPIVKAQETTSLEFISPLDTKIIIWWSLDGKNWEILDTLAEKELSNALNGGYFEIDAPFLKSFEDLKNLKIKFEGVAGGETKLTAFLDSVWVEVEYKDIEEPKVDLENISLILKDKKIDFVYTDDNSGENLIIKTDKRVYVGATRANVYFSVTNIGKNTEPLNIQVHFPEDMGEVKKIEKFEGREWQKLKISKNQISDKRNIFEKLFGLGIQRKPIPPKFKAKAIVNSAENPYLSLIEPGQTQFFRMEISFPPQSAGEFYIETIGESGYGILDPWWNAYWNYKKPITIDNTQNSNSLSEFQVLVKIDSSQTDFWNHVQSDGDDVRFVNSSETQELDYYQGIMVLLLLCIG